MVPAIPVFTDDLRWHNTWKNRVYYFGYSEEFYLPKFQARRWKTELGRVWYTETRENDCFFHIHSSSGDIAKTIKYLADDPRINGTFIEFAVPVFREFQARDLSLRRVAGSLIDKEHPSLEKNILIIFEKMEIFEKRIISAETV